ncbi:MAG: hypothetical protein HOP10_12050 [Chitinophagaceae bacterium]|nr:hypothetical protein [Chitinophagaceae bacterium]
MKSKLLFTLLLSLSLLSCKLDHTYYFRNFSANPVILLFPITEPDSIDQQEYFYYKKEILEIDKHTEEKLTDTIHLTRTRPDKVSIRVPPNSTIRINPLGFNRDEILIVLNKIINNSPAYTIVDTITSLKARYTGGILAKPYGYYDYKE